MAEIAVTESVAEGLLMTTQNFYS